jgi:sugar/nucleoside kinase (ribokinase family)
MPALLQEPTLEELEHTHTGVYAAMYDAAGELVAAVASMDVFDLLDPAREMDTATWERSLGAAEAVVVDANLSGAAIARLAARLAHAVDDDDGSVGAGSDTGAATLGTADHPQTPPVASSLSLSSLSGGTLRRPASVRPPLFFEGTSVAKCVRVLEIEAPARELALIKCNAMEADALAAEIRERVRRGLPVDEGAAGAFAASIERALAGAASGPIEIDGGPAGIAADMGVLLAWGVPRVVVTLGAAGAVFAERSAGGSAGRGVVTVAGHVPAEPCRKIVNVSGAGDAALTGIVYGLVRGRWPLATAVALGLRLARLTLEDEAAVAACLCPAIIDTFARHHAGGAGGVIQSRL